MVKLMNDFEWIKETDLVMTREELNDYLMDKTPYKLLRCGGVKTNSDDDYYFAKKEREEGRFICFFWLSNVSMYDGGYRIKDILKVSKRKMEETSVWTIDNPNARGYPVKKYSKQHYSRIRCAKNYKEFHETLLEL
jgi:hypothetical protein